MKNQFEKHIQKAMSNHELPVSDSVWQSIQKKQSKKPLIYYISRASAACLILFLGFFTYSNFFQTRENIDQINIEQKQISSIELNHSTMRLEESFAVVSKKPVEKNSYKPTIQKHTQKELDLNIPEREVIVLKIKTNRRKRQNNQHIPLRTKPQIKTHVDTEILLAQLEEKLSKKDKKAFDSYIADIKKLASKNSINNKIQTAQNWIHKTASDIGITNKKNKNND